MIPVAKVKMQTLKQRLGAQQQQPQPFEWTLDSCLNTHVDPEQRSWVLFGFLFGFMFSCCYVSTLNFFCCNFWLDVDVRHLGRRCAFHPRAADLHADEVRLLMAAGNGVRLVKRTGRPLATKTSVWGNFSGWSKIRRVLEEFFIKKTGSFQSHPGIVNRNNVEKRTFVSETERLLMVSAWFLSSFLGAVTGAPTFFHDPRISAEEDYYLHLEKSCRGMIMSCGLSE